MPTGMNDLQLDAADLQRPAILKDLRRHLRLGPVCAALGDPLPGQVKFTFWHVTFFAWFCNMAMHIGMSDLSIFRFARKSWYGIASGAGMYVGHFMAWISAALLYSLQLYRDPTNTDVLPGPLAQSALGLTGVVFFAPTLYLGLRFTTTVNATLINGLGPLITGLLAALLIAGGYGLAVWAMVANRYFSSVARIQDDRAQQVVTTGPYRFVRHPSYAGALLASLVLPVMLSTLWALIPGLLLVAALVVRTGLEDRMLLDGLDGYRRYAQRMRFRLIPGLW